MAQAQNIGFQIVEIKTRYNASNEYINSFVERWLQGIIPAVAGGERKFEGVPVYAHDTWGSCRSLKIVATINGQFIDGEWTDNSSRKNVHKFKIAKIESLVGKEIELYVSYSPSCNKFTKFRVMVRIDAIQ